MAGHLSNRHACGATAGEGRMEVTPFWAVSRTPAGGGRRIVLFLFPLEVSPGGSSSHHNLTVPPEDLLSRSHPFRVFPRGAEGI